jgi:uncharacterized phage protein (TIGR01671 family)
MKREIKFRGWRRKYQCWEYGYLIECPAPELNEIVEVTKSGGRIIAAVERDSIGQYTGLHDKNGREIYEGDLFEHRFGYIVFDDPPHDEMRTEYGVVVLEDGQFGVKIPGLGVYNLYGLLLREGHLDNMPKDDLFVMKISGNIYENPELLEVEK